MVSKIYLLHRLLSWVLGSEHALTLLTSIGAVWCESKHTCALLERLLVMYLSESVIGVITADGCCSRAAGSGLSCLYGCIYYLVKTQVVTVESLHAFTPWHLQQLHVSIHHTTDVWFSVIQSWSTKKKNTVAAEHAHLHHPLCSKRLLAFLSLLHQA